MTENQFYNTPPFPDEIASEFFRNHSDFFGKAVDPQGIQIMAMTKMVSNLMEVCFSQSDPENELTPARWGLLVFLMEQENKGNCDGITPTSMSQTRNVKKNTISSLLRGMEEQGLIERNLDAEDRRIFRIRLTEKGRDLVKNTSPLRVKMLSKIVSGLEASERQALVKLLEKLIHSVAVNGNVTHFPPPLD